MRKCAEAWIESLKREKLMWEKCFWFDQAGAFFFFLSVWVYFGKRYKLWRARTATKEVISLTWFHILILWHFVSGFTALGKSPRLKAGPRRARTVSSLHLLPPFSRALGPLLPRRLSDPQGQFCSQMLSALLAACFGCWRGCRLL